MPKRRRVFHPNGAELGNVLVATGWTARAACRDADPEAFFDVGRRAEALAYCVKCPVTTECAEAGLTEAGVWGGHDVP